MARNLSLLRKTFQRLLILSFASIALTAQAAAPNRIVYQGRLSKSGVSISGAHTFVARILSANGTPLWSSGNMTETLPATGEFTLILEPTGVDWASEKPTLEITVDGDTLHPTDPFSTSPYAFFANQVADSSVTTIKIAAGAVTNDKVAVGAAIDPTKIAISGSKTLADWRSPNYPDKINASVIEGTVPVSSNQIEGTALVAFATFTQLIEPTQIVMPLRIKPRSGVSTSIDILKLQTEAGSDAVIFHSTGDVDIAGRLKDKTGFLLPVGTIVAFGGEVAPQGWLLCNGSEYDQTGIYADLFTAIQNAYCTAGGGCGSGKFRVPNLQRRIPVGAGGTGTTTLGNAVGNIGGEEDHVLTASEIPSHSHTQNSHNHTQDAHGHSITDPGHAHSTAYGGVGNGGAYPETPYVSDVWAGAAQNTGAAGTSILINGNTATNQAAIATNQNAGGGLSHNNIPPSLVINYIIKY